MKIMFAIVAILIVVNPICAQNRCYSQSYYEPTYYQPTYKEYVTYREVLVPLFTPYPVFVDPRFSYHYSNGNHLGIALAPVGIQGMPHGMSQQQQQQMSKPMPAADAETNIEALIDKAIEKRIRERQSQQGYEPDGPPAIPGGVSFQAPKLAARNLIHVLQSNCALCHTGAKSQANFVIFESPGRISPATDFQAIWDAIKEDRMPPKGRPKLKASDKQIVQRDLGI